MGNGRRLNPRGCSIEVWHLEAYRSKPITTKLFIFGRSAKSATVAIYRSSYLIHWKKSH
jgi:hypothetical protein